MTNIQPQDTEIRALQPDRADSQATARTRSRYQRVAPVYDAIEFFAERRYRHWRRKLWSRVEGPQVLEVGVGTGKNIPFYPAGVEITAIDLTPGMLARARRRAERLGARVDLRLEDAQALSSSNNAFDTAVGTFVFCSIPDPVLGLRELARVVRPGGQILLLEHVRSPREAVGKPMDLLDPLVSYLIGVHINRRTVENVRKAGLVTTAVEELALGGIFKLIEARVLVGSK